MFARCGATVARPFDSQQDPQPYHFTLQRDQFVAHHVPALPTTPARIAGISCASEISIFAS